MNHKLRLIARAWLLCLLFLLAACSAGPQRPADTGLALEGPAKQSYIARRVDAIFHHAGTRREPFTAPEGISRERFTFKGLPLERLKKNKSGSRLVVLQLHGGGYVGRLSNTYRKIGALQLELSGARELIMVDYRLAPKHVYPAALEDALKAYSYIMQQGTKPEDIVVIGDSAGGNLALALAVQLRQKGIAQPGALILISPWTAMFTSYPSRALNAERDLVLGKNNPRMHGELCRPSYAGTLKLDDPRLSPVLADLRGLPPMLIQTGQYDMLLDDALELAKKASEDGVAVTLSVYAAMPHDFSLLIPELKESSDSFREIREFIMNHCGAETP